MDKRGRKTLKNIETAFNTLLLAKTFDDITVTDICHEADISRKTFYTYYDDKFELIDQLANSALDELDQLSHGDPDMTNQERIYTWLTYIQAHQRLFYILFTNESSYSFRLKFTQYLLESLNKHGAFPINDTNLQFYAHGALGVVEGFVNGAIKSDIATIAANLQTLIPIKA
ncbi:TetR/AcrR family transcriptional regulator [Weissella viridescens]|uniref:TetR/AcrR family transcriptional regulator n=1 Tax=Weissella viridescens TaxID=1629 RepID=A0A3P2RBZ6_WEIVI|nr:TetR/AcrR family transcriptional regulator [Weissella viridescens]RRG18084.1 TetR/AcrR family transcriptional regulator [Weissella viridescens]